MKRFIKQWIFAVVVTVSLTGCTTLAEHNQKLTFSFANSFSIESTVAKVEGVVAERTLKIDKSVLEYVIGNGENVAEGGTADGVASDSEPDSEGEGG